MSETTKIDDNEVAHNKMGTLINNRTSPTLDESFDLNQPGSHNKYNMQDRTSTTQYQPNVFRKHLTQALSTHHRLLQHLVKLLQKIRISFSLDLNNTQKRSITLEKNGFVNTVS